MGLQHARVPLATVGTTDAFITPAWYRSIEDMQKLVIALQARVVTLEAAVTALGGDVETIEEGGYLLLE